MADTKEKRLARGRVFDALKRELMGPAEAMESIKEFPRLRYIIGRLAPTPVDEADNDARVEQFENDSLETHVDGDEEQGEDANPPLVIAFNPSSMGLSFLVEAGVERLDAEIRWGDYKREKDGDEQVWKRYPRQAFVRGVPIGKSGKLPVIPLTARGELPAGTRVEGLDDDEIFLEGVVHEFSGYRAVSLFLVNRRRPGVLKDRAKDERWLFQPELFVRGPGGDAVFVAKDLHRSDAEQDGENAINNLLYRHALEFATGHGVAADWEDPVDGGIQTTEVRTAFIPTYEVPLLVAGKDRTGNAQLDMKELAQAPSGDAVVRMLEPMLTAYEKWVDDRKAEAAEPEIHSHPEHREAAQVNLTALEACARRMREGLNLIGTDGQVFQAFVFANKVMWDQRIHSLWAAANRKGGEVSGSPADFDDTKSRTWRPFQMGFILLNLAGIRYDDQDNVEDSDRQLVDLLWFPTGGGKTEAYLGLAAFTMAIRRLMGDRYGRVGGAGVSIVMRYTLRLLTIQQFQRAAALICSCEVARRANPKLWGAEPFRIGVWVGRKTTPNTYLDSKKALEELTSGYKPKEGSPVQLVACPRCGTGLVTDRGVPENQTYIADDNSRRTLIMCRNPACAFCARKSEDNGLPVVVVDEEIYRTCPTLLIATVDKFARLPFKGATQALFGLRNRYSETFGHLTNAHDDVEGRKPKDALPAEPLLPPDLIIQDELHLISGPLGTMVGLYETAVDVLCTVAIPGGGRRTAKVIASTATIRRARQQVNQLYGGRRLNVFPAPGLSATDSFFANQVDVDPDNDETAGRFYVGLNAPGSSSKTLLVRVYAVLLAAAQAEMESDPKKDQKTADPYATLVGYFNSLRALGGAKRLVEDDVNIRLNYLKEQRGYPRRSSLVIEELTSRMDSWKIPGLLKRLDIPFPRKDEWPVDVLLATNMISVGVDIDRLGLMVVTGQPKTTSEYIQASSRVGRKHPGLVVTMYNWMGARDLSHYERFRSYHAGLYRYVEAISVTPFSSRAIDRGLQGVLAGMVRLLGANMSKEPEAQNFDPANPLAHQVIDAIVERAQAVVGNEEAQRVRDRLLHHCDHWAHLAEELLRYCWLDDARKPPNNTRVLLKTAGTNNEGNWKVPGSLREVEPTAAFYLAEDDE